MQSEKGIVVLKFGSSVLRSANDLPTAVHEIYRWRREGFQVVAVVSAFGISAARDCVPVQSLQFA